jgi:hypothetical protein
MLTSEILPYEILIRFDQDGSIKGIHQKHLRVIKDGLQTIAANELIAPLTLPPDLQAQLKAIMAERPVPAN